MKTINNKQYEECFVQAPVINPDNTINILAQKDSWNRDEVVELIDNYRLMAWGLDGGLTVNTMQEWISKNL